MRYFSLLLIFLFSFHQIIYTANHRNIHARSYHRITRSKGYQPRTFSSCFEDLGCIETNEKWYNEKYRPRNLEPLDRHTIRTEFLLMKPAKNNTNELVYDVMGLKKATVQVAGFKPSSCTIFVIHDFTSNGYTGWIKHLVIAFKRKTDCNIISVDWQAGAEPPFEQAIANARVVALETKLFISLLICVSSQSADNIHIIGHGVGAHIAGYVGKYIKGIQRITALDPTGPMFEKMPEEVRLDAADAKYVEILHTDSYNYRSQGGRITHGHVDFFLNNADHQPGCNDSTHMPSFLDLHRDCLQEGKILPDCSHKRAFKYYIQAVEDDDCQFIGLRCDTYTDFQLGKCNDCNGPKGACATFGLVAPAVATKNNTYYMITNSKKPFCMVSYAVNVTIAESKTKKESEGYFEIILVDEKNKVTNATNNVHGMTLRKYNSGHTYKLVFYALAPKLDKIKEAKVKWIHKTKKICVFCDKAITIHDIGIKRLTIKPEPAGKLSWICPMKKDTEMKSGDYIEFVNCEDMYGANYATNHSQLPKTQAKPQGHEQNKTGAAMGGKGNITNISAIPECEDIHGNATTNKPKVATTTGKPTTTISPECKAFVESREDTPTHTSEASTTKRAEESSSNPEEDVTKAVTPYKEPSDEEEVTKAIKSFKDCFDEDVTTVSSTTREVCENMDPDKTRREENE